MGWQVVVGGGGGGGGGVESVNGDAGPEVELLAVEVPFNPEIDQETTILGGAENVQVALVAAAAPAAVAVSFDPGSPASVAGGSENLQDAVEYVSSVAEAAFDAAGIAVVLADEVGPSFPYVFDGLDWDTYARFVVEAFDMNASSGPAEVALVGRAGGSDLGNVHRVQFVIAVGVVVVTSGDDEAADVALVGSLGSFDAAAEHGWTKVELRSLPGRARMNVHGDSQYGTDATTEVNFDAKATVVAECDGFRLRVNSGAATVGRIVVTGWKF